MTISGKFETTRPGAHRCPTCGAAIYTPDCLSCYLESRERAEFKPGRFVSRPAPGPKRTYRKNANLGGYWK